MPKIYACIWSNDKAAEMAKFYKSIFKNTKVGKTSYWGANPMGVKEGSVLTMHLTLLGQKIMLLNGYIPKPFNESISLVVPCKTQREIDTYWKKLTSGGGQPLQCGWLIDKYGVHWQKEAFAALIQTQLRQRTQISRERLVSWRVLPEAIAQIRSFSERLS